MTVVAVSVWSVCYLTSVWFLVLGQLACAYWEYWICCFRVSGSRQMLLLYVVSASIDYCFSYFLQLFWLCHIAVLYLVLGDMVRLTAISTDRSGLYSVCIQQYVQLWVYAWLGELAFSSADRIFGTVYLHDFIMLLYLGWLFWVDPVKWVSNVYLSVRTYVRPSVRPSTKRFFNFNEIWHAGRCRWVKHDGMQCDPIQGQGQDHEPLTVGNPFIFQSYLLRHLQWGL